MTVSEQQRQQPHPALDLIRATDTADLDLITISIAAWVTMADPSVTIPVS